MKEEHLSYKQIVEEFHISKSQAYRWIKFCNGDDHVDHRTKQGRGPRPRRLRRVARSLLNRHLHELMNG